jgi:pimeloyl-ACP methyl ester carboxylesterase
MDAASNPRAESLTLRTRDGLQLRAWLVHPDPGAIRVPAVILLHGLSGNRDSMAGHATLLAQLGYASLALELRAHGASDGKHTTFGLDEVEDVRSAVDAMAHRSEIDGQRLAILGHSLGALVAAQAAAQIEAIRAVVTESVFLGPRAIAPAMIRGFTGRPPIPSVGAVLWMMARVTGRPVGRIDLTTIVPSLRQPMLFVHGTADGIVPIAQSEQLATLAGGRAQHYWVKGADHSNLSTFDAPDYERRLSAFLQATLGDGTDSQTHPLAAPRA